MVITHIPRVVYLANGFKIVINPGSVGLPAYKDELPVVHKMESGTPHAKICSDRRGFWRVG